MNDKTKHFIVGSVAGIATLPFSFVVGFTNAVVAVFLIASLIFFSKELYDKIKPLPTGFDKMDLIADYIGLATGYIISYIVYFTIKIIQL